MEEIGEWDQNAVYRGTREYWSTLRYCLECVAGYCRDIYRYMLNGYVYIYMCAYIYAHTHQYIHMHTCK